MAEIDPVELTAELVRCPSVTPEEGGALVLLEAVLSKAIARWRVQSVFHHASVTLMSAVSVPVAPSLSVTVSATW